MSANIERTRFIGSGGGRVRVRLIGEALEPTCVKRVGPSSMGHPVRPHAAVSEVDQVEPRCTRRKGEISDADKVSVADATLMSLQSVACTPNQTGIDLTVDTVCSSESKPSSRGTGSKAGKRKIDKKTAGKYQDIELHHK
jgi:hypothetical protein